MAKVHYKIRSGLLVRGVTSDPIDAEEGDLIFRSDLTPPRYRIYRGGVWADLHDSGWVHQTRSTDSTTTGANATLDAFDTPFVEITNASLTSVDMAPAGEDGQVVTITNRTGADFDINNETGGTAANRIKTGTGNALTVANEASITLIYNASASRWFVVGGSGGGGGVVKIKDPAVTGITGATVTFPETYVYGKEAMFFRNGVKMRKVASFTPAVDEYQEVNSGPASTQITLAPGYEAEVEDVFEMYFVANTFDGVGLAEKTLHTARGYADGSQTVNCSISTVSNKTRVVVSGFTLEIGVAPSETIGHHTVEVNGQEIERKLVGVNDNVGNIVYEEVSGTTIDIYEITAGPSTAALAADAEVRVRQVQYVVAELDAIGTHILPAIDDTYDLGSATHRWRDLYVGPGSVHIGSAGRITFNETTQKLEFSNDDGASSKPLGSGSGGGGVDLVNQLSEDELDILLQEPTDQIIDDFSDSEKGTKTNVSQSLSALRLNTGFNTGTYERIRETSTKVGAVQGVAVVALQAIAPKNAGLSGNAWTISGNVAGYFNTSNEVLICKRITSDGKTVHVFIRKDDDTIARFTPSSVVYNSGPNETVVTLANPDALDLDLDVTSGNYNSQIRLIPMGHEFEVKSLAASSYEVMNIANAHGSDSITIPGQAAFLEAVNFTGTVIHHDVKMSPNGTYGIFRVMEKGSPTDNWRFYGTANGGNTWTLLGSKNYNGSPAEELNWADYHIFHQNNVIVADNGKWFSAYAYWDGADIEIKGVYGNLGLSDFNDTGAQNPGNPGGAIGTIGVGNILVGASNYGNSFVSGDTTDLSMVAVLIKRQGLSLNGSMVYYSNGGATHFATQYEIWSTYSISPSVIKMVGSAPNRRLWMFYRHGTDNGVRALYMRESDNFQIRYDANGGGAGTESLLRSSSVLQDVFAHNNKILAVYHDFSNNVYFRYISNAETGTTSLAAEQQINPNAHDTLLGTSDDDGVEGNIWYRHLNNRGVLENDRFFYTHDYYHGDTIRRTVVHEIRDITTHQGWHTQQTSVNANSTFRNATAQSWVAQTFTANSSRVRCFNIRAFQTGIIPDGHTLTCEIQTLSANTTSGVPTGTVVATAINSYNPRNISKTDYQDLFFNFDSPALTNGTWYAFVLKSSFPVSASNYLNFKSHSGNIYGAGSQCNWDGSTWTAFPASFDLFFRIIGDWMYDLSHETRASGQEYGYEVWNQEATLAKIDSNNLRMAHKRAITSNVGVGRSQSGHIWNSLITLGSGGNASTYTAPTQIGHQSFDKNLVFAVGLGLDSSARIDRTTGAIDANNKAETRSGVTVGITSNTLVAADFISDVSSSTGYVGVFNGSSKWVIYDHNPFLNFEPGYGFCIEAEFRTNTLAAAQTILGKYLAGSGGGWALQIRTDGGIDFDGFDNAGNNNRFSARAVASTVAINTWYVIRCTYDGLGGAPKIFLSTTGPNGTFTEVSYASTVAFGTAVTSTETLKIGANNSNTAPFNGRISYVKIAKGASSFAYIGYKDQRAMQGIINTGSKIYVETKGGNMGVADINTSYDEFGRIDPNGSSTSIVDSNDIYLFYEHSIAGTKGQAMYLRTTMNRASSTDAVTALRGINFKFSK
jgi:hypothetical protein